MIEELEELTFNEIAELLEQRCEKDSVKTLKDLPKPLLLKDIENAVAIITDSIQNNEKIVLVGDYDVDGVVASTIVKEFFDSINTDIKVILPNRFSDGYGLSPDIVAAIEADLIITVDNGISSIEAAQIAKTKGIKLVITDHHICPENLPEADAIVNPKREDCNYPEENIAGATVAWYLVAALKDKLDLKLSMAHFLDIMSFAILADAMPLRSVNRTLVKAGIDRVNKSTRPAIAALKSKLNIQTFGTGDIMFAVNPRLNSAGRMADATTAFNFLSAKTLEEAHGYLEELDALNSARKEAEKSILEKAKKMMHQEDAVLVVWGENWHEGVIGIVAARLTEQFSKPSIVFSIKNGAAKGSGRSKENVNLLELIKSAKECLDGFGGHRNAAGMQTTVQKLQEFKEKLNTNISYEESKEYDAFGNVLGKLSLEQVNLKLLSLLSSFEPFGQAFPFPYFVISNVVPKRILKMGIDKSHLLLVFEVAPYVNVSAVWFNYTQEVSESEPISFIYTVGKNSFRGNDEAQVQIKHLVR